VDSLAGLSRQLKSVTGLNNLVKTLKVLSAVNLRIFSRVCQATEAYLDNIEQGLQVVLKALPMPPVQGRGEPKLVVLGSDHGLCGAFHTNLLHRVEIPTPMREVICVGTRLAEAAQDLGLRVDQVISAPTSAAGMAEVGAELLQHLLPMDGGVQVLYQHSQLQASTMKLWPLDELWLGELRQRPWLKPGQRGGLPRCWGEPGAALEWLLEEHLQVRLQQALAHSLASESQARLLTMQAAEKNLDEMRAGLQDNLQSRRQNAVTEELLDVIAGFEILRGEQLDFN